MNIKKGDILKEITSSCNKKVLAIMEDLVFMSAFDMSASSSWYTFSEIEKYFEVPKESFVLKEGEDYWSIETDGGVDRYEWCDDLSDKSALEFGNVFPSKESAEAAALKVKELFKGLK